MIEKFFKGAQLEDLTKARFPVLASRKIDGFRCLIADHPLTSRLSRFPNEHFHRSLLNITSRDKPLDSEAVVGRRRGPGVLSRTSSGLTGREGEPDFTCWVFDQPGPGGFAERLDRARRLVRDIGHPQVRFLKHRLIERLEDLEDYIDESLSLEYEGVMITSPLAPYKQGKGTVREGYRLKIKPFVDAEGRVIGWFEEQENTNEARREATGKLKRSSAKAGKVAKGTLGGLILEDLTTGVEVRVGGGFTKDQRKRLWVIREQLLGKLVKYKKQKMGEKDKPRHPNFVEFLDFRPDWDL